MERPASTSAAAPLRPAEGLRDDRHTRPPSPPNFVPTPDPAYLALRAAGTLHALRPGIFLCRELSAMAAQGGQLLLGVQSLRGRSGVGRGGRARQRPTSGNLQHVVEEGPPQIRPCRDVAFLVGNKHVDERGDPRTCVEQELREVEFGASCDGGSSHL